MIFSTPSEQDPLQHAVWNSLTQVHSDLAEGNDLALRFRPAYAPFAALARHDAACFHALATLMAPGEEAAFFTLDDVALPPSLEVTLRRDILQMVCLRPPQSGGKSVPSAPLGPDDVDDMRALVAATQPGPFRERTPELGNFIGIRVDGRLVAMAGERLQLLDYREISAVCTLPEFRGRGYAAGMITALAQASFARGQTPFLHAFTDNTSAIALYTQLGFTPRNLLRVTGMRRV